MENNKKSNIVLTIIFSSILVCLGTNLYTGKKIKQYNQEIKDKSYRNYSLISANVVSNTKIEKNKNTISYLIDVDYDNDNKKDSTIALVNNVKYVSKERMKKIETIKKGSKIIFECNVKSHIENVNTTISINDIKKTIPFPKIIIDSIFGNSAVGLIDNVVVIDGKIYNNTKRELYTEYLDYYDNVDKFGDFDKTNKLKDGNIEKNVFEELYKSHLQAR